MLANAKDGSAPLGADPPVYFGNFGVSAERFLPAALDRISGDMPGDAVDDRKKTQFNLLAGSDLVIVRRRPAWIVGVTRGWSPWEVDFSMSVTHPVALFPD